MDYGKLAYLRLDDLEPRLDKITYKKPNAAYAVLEPDFEFIRNGFDAAEIGGGREMQLLVKITALVNTEGSINLALDGIFCSGAEFFGSGTQTAVVIAAITAEAGATLSISAANGFEGVLKRIEICLSGEGAFIKTEETFIACDYNEETAVLLRKESSSALSYMFFYPSTTNFSGEWNFAGKALACDIVEKDGVFYVVCCDNFSNMWGMVLSEDGFERVFLGDAKGSVCVCSYGSRLVIAYADGGKVWFFTSDLNFGSVTSAESIDAPDYVKSVHFVKRSEYPVLVLQCKDKAYLKTAVDEQNTDGTVSVSVSVKTEAVK